MPSFKQAPVLLWFRKDLRLDDNLALAAAAQTGRPVIPVYVLEAAEAGTGPLGLAQAWWLHHSLAALSQGLEAIGSRLILRRGVAVEAVLDMIDQTGATTVLWNRRYDPAGIAVDTLLKSALRDRGIEVHSFAGQLLHEPSRLKTGAGGPYRVYTPFWRALQANGEPPEPVEAPDRLVSPPDWPASEPLTGWRLLPDRPNWAREFSDVWTPGEAAARQRLSAFVESRLAGYKAGRDKPAGIHTSMLSPHLALGEISPSRIWHATRGLPPDMAEDVVKFRQELAWRDFSYHLLFHFPALAEKNWNDRFDDFGWRDDEAAFTAWTKGMTGYPIVDAGMRQLWRHGTMHNRVRMIVASFLIKDLLIDWRRGEKWFRDTLVDADPAANAASWQWVAGSGADAAPFFRVFNPMLQGEKFDADGAYVRQFVPELARLDDKYIHRPFEAPDLALAKAGVVLGRSYPRPIVDHGRARDAALSAYRRVTDG